MPVAMLYPMLLSEDIQFMIKRWISPTRGYKKSFLILYITVYTAGEKFYDYKVLLNK